MCSHFLKKTYQLPEARGNLFLSSLSLLSLYLIHILDQQPIEDVAFTSFGCTAEAAVLPVHPHAW